MFIIMFCSSQWCFLSFCLTFFLYFFLSFLFALHGSQGLKGMSGMSACILLCFLLVVVVGIFLITPRPLQPAVLLSKYSIRDRAAPPPLSSRTSSYHILRSTTCWVHRAISIPHDPLVSLCVSAGDLGYVKHPHTAETKFATCNISLRN